MSDVMNLFAGLDREQVQRFRVLSMPVLWQLRDAVEADDKILTVDLTRAVAPPVSGRVAPPQKVTTKQTKGVPKDE